MGIGTFARYFQIFSINSGFIKLVSYYQKQVGINQFALSGLKISFVKISSEIFPGEIFGKSVIFLSDARSDGNFNIFYIRAAFFHSRNGIGNDSADYALPPGMSQTDNFIFRFIK